VGNVISEKGGIRAVTSNDLTVRQLDITSESGEVLLVPDGALSLMSANAYLNYVEDFANSRGKSTACVGKSETQAPSGERFIPLCREKP
jgi:hypothetical protein